VFHPITLLRAGTGRSSSSSNDPGGSQVALLAEVGTKNPHIEVLGLHAAKPPVEHSQRGINRYGLMVVGWCTRTDRSGVGTVLPEE
jgi:hypothetical protein